MLLLIFDTETTGLPKTKNISKEDLPLWPYVVQFSYILFNTETKQIEKIVNEIIKIPLKVEISEEASAIHGITKEKTQKKGFDIETLIQEMSSDIIAVDLIVGHNITFDINMLLVETMRLSLNALYTYKQKKYTEFAERLKIINTFCTMSNNIDLCAIKTMSKKDGKEYNKFPKLVELHQTLFGTIPPNLHNSLMDVLVCLRCYIYVKEEIDLLKTDNMFGFLWAHIT
jgi:DNA polymerase III epsilon subunit-like protein